MKITSKDSGQQECDASTIPRDLMVLMFSMANTAYTYRYKMDDVTASFSIFQTRENPFTYVSQDL